MREKLSSSQEEVLGTGMHGAVLVAKHRKSGRRVAAKCLDGADNGSLPDEAGPAVGSSFIQNPVAGKSS